MTYRWLEESHPFVFEGFRVHCGPPPVVHDYFTGTEVAIVGGSHWYRWKDRRPKDDPIVVAALVEFKGDGEVCFLTHRLSDLPRWKDFVPTMNVAYPWPLRDILSDLLPTSEHPRSWAYPSIWDRLEGP